MPKATRITDLVIVLRLDYSNDLVASAAKFAEKILLELFGAHLERNVAAQKLKKTQRKAGDWPGPGALSGPHP